MAVFQGGWTRLDHLHLQGGQFLSIFFHLRGTRGDESIESLAKLLPKMSLDWLGPVFIANFRWLLKDVNSKYKHTVTMSFYPFYHTFTLMAFAVDADVKKHKH